MLSNDLIEKIMEFRRLRDWAQFHTPRNLAAAISIEAAELLEPFRWARDDDINSIVASQGRQISNEIADLVILLTYLVCDLGIDLNSAVESKISENESKYPAEIFKGSSKKYSDA